MNTNSGPQVRLDSHRKRLHLNHGPIDLIVSCDGVRAARAAALEAATARFEGLLEELVEELPLLRTPVSVDAPQPSGQVAQRMFDAVQPFARHDVITPMAAVAGAVADEVGSALAEAAPLDRWMVNNGGDIALGLAPGQHYRVGLVVDPRRATIDSTVLIEAGSAIGGVATSGRHGRSFSLGIADSVTVLARTSAAADTAATLIANHVDVGHHRAVIRQPASSIDPDADLGHALVTVEVGALAVAEVQAALAQGLDFAESCVNSGLIEAAVLHLAGTAVATSTSLLALASLATSPQGLPA